MKRVDSPEKADAKYVFLDVVGYTHNRSVEAQSFIIGELNAAVNVSVATSAELFPDCDEIIFLPTGDGMAIAFLNSTSYDIHLRTALQIIETIARLNERQVDPMRKFEVRIGINENVDNVIQDINKNRNVAGSGIAMAQRIMGKADGMQILVGESVHSKLSPRERYMKSFRCFDTVGKHDVTFRVFQILAMRPA